MNTLTKCLMFHADVVRLDGCKGCWGIELPERLLWEAYVMRQDISHAKGWETGRPSEPDYMVMNLHSTRKVDVDQPRVVVYQYDTTNSMNPCGLLIAYEENERVRPVASDFDAFLIGSRGLKYDPVPPTQLPFLESMILHTEAVLAVPTDRSWTHRWLDVLKGLVVIRKDGKVFESSIAGTLGQKRKDGRYGFGDDQSQGLIKELMYQSCVIKSHGAVRHAAECFNYYFPQELDEEFLVLWQGYDASEPQGSGGVSACMRYLGPAELRAFLIDRVRDGFVFPLNPTWVLRDEGWFDVYKAIEASPDCSDALDAWLPKDSGLRERICAIHEAHPLGFVRLDAAAPAPTPAATPAPSPASSQTTGDGGQTAAVAPERTASTGRTAPQVFERISEEEADMADLSLRRYLTLKRAKLKLRAILLWCAARAAIQTRGSDGSPPCSFAAPALCSHRVLCCRCLSCAVRNETQRKVDPARNVRNLILASTARTVRDSLEKVGDVVGFTSVVQSFTRFRAVGISGDIFKGVAGLSNNLNLERRASMMKHSVSNAYGSVADMGTLVASTGLKVTTEAASTGLKVTTEAASTGLKVTTGAASTGLKVTTEAIGQAGDLTREGTRRAGMLVRQGTQALSPTVKEPVKKTKSLMKRMSSKMSFSRSKSGA